MTVSFCRCPGGGNGRLPILPLPMKRSSRQSRGRVPHRRRRRGIISKGESSKRLACGGERVTQKAKAIFGRLRHRPCVLWPDMEIDGLAPKPFSPAHHRFFR